MTIVEFLRQRLDEDEWWAREASRGDGQTGEPAGDHWQWVEADHDHVLSLDPSQYEYVGDEYEAMNVSLRSVEEYPTCSVGPLPHFAIHSADEVATPVGGHIARHGPARVLREVEAKRAILDLAAQTPPGYAAAFTGTTLRFLAEVYADHPDFDPAWAILDESAGEAEASKLT